LNNKVIICKTSGNSKISESKRRKKIAMAIETIMKYLYNETILLFNIKNIEIILKMRVRSHLYTLIKRLKYYKINIVSIISKKKIAHNGIRKKKLRRI
jgi:ribosomal protein S11